MARTPYPAATATLGRPLTRALRRPYALASAQQPSGSVAPPPQPVDNGRSGRKSYLKDPLAWAVVAGLAGLGGIGLYASEFYKVRSSCAMEQEEQVDGVVGHLRGRHPCPPQRDLSLTSLFDAIDSCTRPGPSRFASRSSRLKRRSRRTTLSRPNATSQSPSLTPCFPIRFER